VAVVGVLEQQRVVAKATLALVHATAEYGAPVWCRSAHTRIVTGSLFPSPAYNLLILAGIQPAELRRNGAPLSLARRTMEPGHLLHSALTCPSSANARRLKLRHSFLISSSDNNRSAALWADRRWNAEWLDNTAGLRAFIPDIATHPPGMVLPRTTWVRLNRLHTGVGRFRSCFHK